MLKMQPSSPEGPTTETQVRNRIKRVLSSNFTVSGIHDFVDRRFPMHEMLSSGRYAQILFGFSLVFSAWYCFGYWTQPILEWYPFRQTQTALTSYWLIQNGFSLAYWTPVVGQGWSIPFEFPIYQALVAAIAGVSGAPITQTGRAVSWGFTVASCLPIYHLLRHVGLSLNARYFTLALFMSSPLYTFWGSTFMIESTALFFALCFVFFAARVLENGRSSDFLFGALFLTLCLLQKVTTGLPVAFLFAVVLCARVTGNASLRNRRYLIKTALFLLIPLLTAYAWVKFGDHVKMANPIASLLTSAALQGWNYGTLEQRFSARFWSDVIWQRQFAHNMYGWAGIAVLGASILLARGWKIRGFILLALLAGLLPLFLFTNLHVVHVYYSTASLAFLLIALGAAATALGERYLARTPALYAICLFLFVLSNFDHFGYGYLQNRTRVITADNNRTLKVSEFVRSHTGPEQTVIWYGFDWSSEAAFYSERKSLTVPAWSGMDVDAIDHMEKYLERPAALVVLCRDAPNEEKIRAAIVRKYGAVRQHAVGGCMVYFLADSAPGLLGAKP